MRIKDLARDPSLPICPKCNIPMEIHKTMTGDRYTCDNYAYCGESLPVISKRNKEDGKTEKHNKEQTV